MGIQVHEFYDLIYWLKGVGKSCLLNQFLNHTFNAEHETTIGVEFGSKIMKIDDT